MISLVPSESWGGFKWVRASARNLGAGPCPPRAFGRTRSLCRSSSSHRNRFAGFRREPCWGDDKTPVLHFRHFRVGVVSLPSGCCGCVGTTPRGVYFGRKTAFSEWVLCADERAVPSCTQRFFGVPAWGWYHYPRRAFHAVETLDAHGSRRRICRFYAVPEFALCGLNIPAAGTHATPAPNRAHSGSHGETRGVFTARDIGRVDRVNSLGTLCIVTFGTAQFDEPLSVAAAHHGGNADFA